MERIVDIKHWKRREHFEFFSSFEEPFFGLVADVDCTHAYHTCKEKGYSFFLYYLYQSLVAVNGIEELRYRIRSGAVVDFGQIHASSTIGRANDTFAYSFIEFASTFEAFSLRANAEIEAVQQSEGLRLTDSAKRLDVIHYSSIPWVKFTGLTHARSFTFPDSVPKISFGKCTNVDGRMVMPVSVNAHHGLVDGLHVGLFFQRFQELLSQ